MRLAAQGVMRFAGCVVWCGLLLSPAAFAEDRREPIGVVGAGAGFGVVTGRSLVVDSVSGASTSVDDVDTFTKSVFVSGITADFFLFESGGPGGPGMRVSLDGSVPGPFFALALMPRYRWHIETSPGALRSFNPWIGAGFGIEVKDDVDDLFYGFPIGAGLDVELGLGAFLTAEVDVTMINPWGPERDGMTVEGPRRLEDHMNRVIVKLGVAWPMF